MEGIILGDKETKYPIIQGGMGVGVSLHKLAGTVSKEGGIGIISTADIGYKEEDFYNNPIKANLRAIGKEIKKAREIAGKDKILGVNIMVALKNYTEIVKECVKQKIDLIVSGAGIPKELPQYVKGSSTKIAPIVSSLRSCQLIVKHWIKKYDYIPDMIIVEGPEAGGHLGFKKEELEGEDRPNLENIIKEILNYIKEIKKQYNKKIPVIAAGGIWDKNDIDKFLKIGADGVQMATRFVTTYECDASEEFKKAYIDSKQEDIKIINSPVGMPGRAIYNNFIKQTEKVKEKVDKCYGCIKTCNIVNTPYCITKALINSVKGNVENGLVFCGSNVYKAKELISVHNLMKELMY
ncbi:MAG: nitronate monooxygenase [Clostridia bacterium]|jgi:nitronate monooxygenase|nr:nitronate monooxygenase [Clostridia bacterium]